MTSSARTIRRALRGPMPVGRHRVRRRELGVQRPGALGLDARPRAAPGPRRRCPGNSMWSSSARTYRPEPPTATARWPRPSISSSAARARCLVVARPRRPRARPGRPGGGAGRPAARRAVSLAVPMSMPRYSCMASALTTSPPSACASASPRSDLPVAVGPTTATTRVIGVSPGSVGRGRCRRRASGARAPRGRSRPRRGTSRRAPRRTAARWRSRWSGAGRAARR